MQPSRDTSTATVLVTGASRGIGRAISETLARRGCALALTARDVSALDDVRKACEVAGASAAFVVAGDQSEPAEVLRIVDEATTALGAIGVLVNNAALSVPRPFTEETPETLAHTLDVNVLGPMVFTQEVGRRMLAAGRGRVVNVASMNAVVGRKNLAAYSASKGALLQLTRSLAVEWAPKGVRVNAVCPGSTWTPMSESLRDNDALHEAVVRTIPLRRLGDASEIASVVEYLALDAPDFVTGAAYAVDGGETAW